MQIIKKVCKWERKTNEEKGREMKKKGTFVWQKKKGYMKGKKSNWIGGGMKGRSKEKETKMRENG